MGEIGAVLRIFKNISQGGGFECLTDPAPWKGLTLRTNAEFGFK